MKRLVKLLDLDAASRYAKSIGQPRDRETLRRAVRRGQIPAELHGGRYYVHAKNVEAYLRNVRRGPSPNLQRRVHRIREELSHMAKVLAEQPASRSQKGVSR